MAKFYIIAGEASGDFIGAKLAAALREASDADVLMRGICGDQMLSAGVEPLFHCNEIAVMGLVEIIPHILRLRRLIKRTIQDIQNFKPDVVITIDAPGFCNRVIDGVKKSGIPVLVQDDGQAIEGRAAECTSTYMSSGDPEGQRTQGLKSDGYTTLPRFVHYVAPSVWAWKPGRAKKLAQRVDHLLCLFQFEPPYFEKHGLKTTCVGHPLVELDWATPQTKPPSQPKPRMEEGRAPTICLLPGSRSSEIERHLDVFAKACHTIPNAEIIIPTFERFVPIIQKTLPSARCVVDPEQKRQAMINSTIAIAASGTVTLELALARTPAIVAYKTSKVTAFILRRLVKLASVCLSNIVVGRSVVPEFLQEKCNADELSKGLQDLLSHNTHQDAAFFDEVRAALTPLDTTNQLAAKVILSYV